MPSGWQHSRGDLLERPPSLALGEGARWHLPSRADCQWPPPMADAVVAVTIFHQHFPSMLAM